MSATVELISFSFPFRVPSDEITDRPDLLRSAVRDGGQRVFE
jgi:hypothetical protein